MAASGRRIREHTAETTSNQVTKPEAPQNETERQRDEKEEGELSEETEEAKKIQVTDGSK